MTNKWYYIIGAVLVVGLVSWLIWGRGDNSSTMTDSPTPTETSLIYSPAPTDSPSVSTSPISKPSGSSWEGTLQVSDNTARGSLMLVTQVNGRPTNIYLRTARDFGALVGENVWVTYAGTIDNFVLLSIAAK